MTQPRIYNKEYLMAAGPTPLPPAVSQVMAAPIPYHRAPAFMAVHERALENLKKVFQTENEVLSFASSGTGGLESAVANLLFPGDVAAVASAGKFGERWAELCRSYCVDLTHLDLEWGERIDGEAIDRMLSEMDEKPRAVFATLSETSTGVVHDVRGIAEAARAHDTIAVIDAISGLAAADLPQDEWGVDVVISGSQKALMTPPGLAFASVSDRAMALATEREGNRFYFDWARTAKGQDQSPPSSPFTPAVTLWMALDVALQQILDEGLPQVFERHAILARAARAGVEAIGLVRFGTPFEGSNVVTAAHLPDSIDGAQVPKLMRDSYGVTAAGGQNDLKGKIVRIAHCGYFGAFDILISLTALENALRDLGYEVEPGTAAGAAQRVFVEAGSPVPVG